MSCQVLEPFIVRLPPQGDICTNDLKEALCALHGDSICLLVGHLVPTLPGLYPVLRQQLLDPDCIAEHRYQEASEQLFVLWTPATTAEATPGRTRALRTSHYVSEAPPPGIWKPASPMTGYPPSTDSAASSDPAGLATVTLQRPTRLKAEDSSRVASIAAGRCTSPPWSV